MHAQARELQGFLFGEHSDSHKQELMMELTSLKMRIIEKINEINALPKADAAKIPERALAGLAERWSELYIRVNDNNLFITLNKLPLNFLYGSYQDAVANDSIIYQSAPAYAMELRVTPTRHTSLRNVTNFSNLNDSISEVMSSAMATLGERNLLSELSSTPRDLGLTLSGQNSNGVCHPHAQGSPGSFSSICYGNNRWSEDLLRLSSGLDFASVIDRVLLWFVSGNMLDMYDGFMSPRIIPPTNESSLPADIVDVVNALFRHVLQRYYTPLAVELRNHSGEPSIQMFENVLPLFRAMNEELANDEEILDILDLKKLLDLLNTYTGKQDASGATMHKIPMLYALIALRGALTNSYPLYSNPPMREYTGTPIALMRRAYAAWLLCNTRYIYNRKHSLLNCLRVDVYAAENPVNLQSGVSFLNFIGAPAGMAAVYCRANGGNVTDPITSLPQYLKDYYTVFTTR